MLVNVCDVFGTIRNVKERKIVLTVDGVPVVERKGWFSQRAIDRLKTKVELGCEPTRKREKAE
jgi:hypothetical protein